MASGEGTRPGTWTRDLDLGASAYEVIRALRKNWGLVVATTILGGGAALLTTKLTTPVYQAIATVEIDPNPVRPLSEQADGFSSYVSFLDNMNASETQYKIMTSDRVLSRVAQDQNLASDGAFLGVPGPVTAPRPLHELAAILRNHLTVEGVKNTRLFTVKYEDSDPKRARRLCDAVVNAYLAQRAENSVSATSEAVSWLNAQVDHYRKELESNENAMYAFKERNALPSTSINEASNMLRLEMQNYAEALTKTRTVRQEMAARAAELAKITTEKPDEIPASELLGNTFLQGLRSTYIQSVRERSELVAEGRGENHPAVRRLEERIEETRGALIREIRTLQHAVERDLAIVIRQEGGENNLYEDARKRAVELNMKEIEFHRLDRNREQNEKLYAMLLERMKQADLARLMNVSNVRLLDAAIEPRSPIRPKGGTNLAIGLLAGALTGLALAWLRLFFDTSVKTPDDVEDFLGATFLGLLPELGAHGRTIGKTDSKRRRRTTSDTAVKAPELVVHERPTSEVAEAARTIRTNLMFMNPDRPFRTLLVTSAAPGEGKTTVACSIAIALAQSGRRVCLVDCDLRRPRLHRIFGQPGQDGVTNVLIGDSSISEVTSTTNIENLSCVTAGPTPPNPADLLHSERFKDFLRTMESMFDHVVIDSPPLVAVTDAAIVSTLVDTTIFVSRAFVTSRQLARRGLRSLRDVDSRIAGVVLNAVNLNRAEYVYQYHQYYYNTASGPVPSKKRSRMSAREDDDLEVASTEQAPMN